MLNLRTPVVLLHLGIFSVAKYYLSAIPQHLACELVRLDWH
jgi:hypothetical protein